MSLFSKLKSQLYSKYRYVKKSLIRKSKIREKIPPILRRTKKEFRRAGEEGVRAEEKIEAKYYKKVLQPISEKIKPKRYYGRPEKELSRGEYVVKKEIQLGKGMLEGVASIPILPISALKSVTKTFLSPKETPSRAKSFLKSTYESAKREPFRFTGQIEGGIIGSKVIPVKGAKFEVPLKEGGKVHYAGVYGTLPSRIPYKYKQPLIGVKTITGEGRSSVVLGKIHKTPEISAGYYPSSAIEGKVIMPSIMKQLSPSAQKRYISAVRIAGYTKGEKGFVRKPIEFSKSERITKRTGKITEAWISKHPKTRVYGSAAQYTQLREGRLPKDIDIAVPMSPKIASTEIFKEITKRKTPEIYRRGVGGISVKFPGTKEYGHALDIHSLQEYKSEFLFGFKAERPLKSKGIKIQPLSEQVGRKAQALVKIRGKEKEIGETHRIKKDVTDFIKDATEIKERLEVSASPLKRRKAGKIEEELELWETFAKEEGFIGDARTQKKIRIKDEDLEFKRKEEVLQMLPERQRYKLGNEYEFPTYKFNRPYLYKKLGFGIKPYAYKGQRVKKEPSFVPKIYSFREDKKPISKISKIKSFTKPKPSIKKEEYKFSEVSNRQRYISENFVHPKVEHPIKISSFHKGMKFYHPPRYHLPKVYKSPAAIKLKKSSILEQRKEIFKKTDVIDFYQYLEQIKVRMPKEIAKGGI